MFEESFSFAPPPELAGPGPRRPVVIVGAGPVGLSLAIDLAQRGIAVVVVDAEDRVSEGSRALCWARRTLEIFDRLGVGAPLVARGVGWQVGKVFDGEDLVHAFDLQPEPGFRRPAFINLQQSEVEAALVARAQALGVELRWLSRVAELRADAEGATLDVATPAGTYSLAADWVIACDGARSTLRRLLGLQFEGQAFDDRFLIADVRLAAEMPAERRFWFDPPFHPGRSALLHRQPDDVWRIDLQLGADADPGAERQPARIRPRIVRMLGREDFEIVWASVYTFQCRRLARFRHGRVVFAGDAAHQVSPFGARGANSGVQDADNLGWKLAAVLAGRAPERLIDSYEAERIAAADENIAHATRSTDFIAPPSAAARAVRRAVLDLARDCPFARPMVNSGRLSTASAYPDSPLSTADDGPVPPGPAPGAPPPDAPLDDGGFLSEALGHGGFTLLAAADAPDADLAETPTIRAAPDGALARRWGLCGGGAYLLRPDGHVAARTLAPSRGWAAAAAARALGLEDGR